MMSRSRFRLTVPQKPLEELLIRAQNAGWVRCLRLTLAWYRSEFWQQPFNFCAKLPKTMALQRL